MTRKNPADQAGQNSKPEMILPILAVKNSILKKSFSTSQKPIMKWWEETLDHHWPYPVPGDLAPDQARIWKIAEIGHALRVLEGRNEIR